LVNLKASEQGSSLFLIQKHRMTRG